MNQNFEFYSASSVSLREKGVQLRIGPVVRHAPRSVLTART